MVDVATRRAFCTLVAAAFVDGNFDNKEKSVIYRKARDLNLPVQTVDEIIELGRTGKLGVSIPPTQQGKDALLNDLIDVACADGRLEPPENHLLMKFASHLGLTVGDLGERVRACMGRGARQDSLRTERPEPPKPTPKPPPPKPELPKSPSFNRDVERSKSSLTDSPKIGMVQAPKAPSFDHDVEKSKASLTDSPKIGMVQAPKAPSFDRDVERSKASLTDSPKLESKDQFRDALHDDKISKPRPHGPVQLSGPSIGADSGEIPPVTLNLIKQVLMFENREEAISYVRRMCNVQGEQEATLMVDQVIRENPDLKVGVHKIRVK